MSTTVPFDTAAIRRYGIEEWRADFPVPVHWRDFTAVLAALTAGVDEIFMSVDRADQDTLLAGTEFIFMMRDFLYAEAVAQWAAQHGRTVDCDPATRSVFVPDLTALARPFSTTAGPGGLQTLARRAARTFVENRPSGVRAQLAAGLSAIGDGNASWSIGTMGGIKAIALAADCEPVLTVYAEPLIARALATSSPRRSARLDAALDAFAADLASLVEHTFGRDLSDAKFSTRRLIDVWRTRLAVTAGVVDTLLRSVRRPPPRVHLNEVWKASHRVLSIALRGLGTDVIAYGHGNEPLHVLQPQHAFMAFGHTTDYVCESPASAAAHAAHYQNSVVSRSFPVRFRSADLTQYAARFAAAAAPMPHGGPVRVMVMGYPMLAHRTHFDVTNGLATHLEAELRLLEWLRSRGFHAIYKAHPETRAAAEGIFEQSASEVSFEPFEEVMNRADIVLFLTTVSSTFGNALCSRKPVVVLDHAGKAWNPMFKDLYARRCRLVPSWLTDDNRIAFDEVQFLTALQFPGPPPDFTLVENVFSPRPWDGPKTIDPSEIGGASAATAACAQ